MTFYDFTDTIWKTIMARDKANPKEQKPIEQTLWDAATKLRGKVESADYKHVVLSLIFLKYANDHFN